MAEALIELAGVRISDPLSGTELVHGIDLELTPGRVLGIVGESGSGKTLTCRSVLGLLPEPLEISAGTVTVFGADAAELDERAWTRLRGSSIAALFQDPGSYLNPSIRVGRQVQEVLLVKAGLGRGAARRRTLELFASVHLRDPELVYEQHPHELSGGMLQRVLIAAAVALEPQVLIADEATTALDVTVQAEILDLLAELTARTELALLVVSHDLAVVARLCDDVLVMHEGRIVERGNVRDVLTAPQQAYTGLLVREHHQFGLERFLTTAGVQHG